jgi:hypothetical protein
MDFLPLPEPMTSPTIFPSNFSASNIVLPLEDVFLDTGISRKPEISTLPQLKRRRVKKNGSWPRFALAASGLHAV